MPFVPATLAALAALVELWRRRARSAKVRLDYDSAAKARELDLEANTGRATIGTSGVRTSLSGASHGHIQSSEGTNDLVLTYLQNLSGQRLRAVFKEAAGETAGYEIPASLEAAISEASPSRLEGLPSGPSLPTHAQGSSASVMTRRFSSAESQLWDVPFSQLELIRRIGEGAFGKVYLGEWNSTMVAVKLLVDLEEGRVSNTASLVAALTQPSPLLSRLREEADIMFSLRHPNCVQLMGVCLMPPCLVVEFCARGSLAFCLAAGRQKPQVASLLTWRRRLAMAYDATKGMLCLHSRSPPIIHRDLKSPNLLVDKDWNVKVADFNLASWEEDLHRQTTDEAMNPLWLAPEVLEGRPATPASDVFSFGVVLWELLTWELPWHTDGVADSHWQVVAKLAVGERLAAPPDEELPGPHRLPPDLHQQYLQLMHDCWADDPVARPTFAAIAVRLREMIRALIAPTGATLPPTPRAAAPRNPADRPF